MIHEYHDVRASLSICPQGWFESGSEYHQTFHILAPRGQFCQKLGEFGFGPNAEAHQIFL